MIDVPQDGPSPKAPEVRAAQRRQNFITAAIGLPLLVLLCLLVGIAVWAALDGRGESSDTGDIVEAAIADNARDACILERRIAEGFASSERNEALGQALIDYLVDGDNQAALVQVSLWEKARDRRIAASAQLEPDTLNQPPPTGCGPPLLATDDVPAPDAG